jgi:hypothetical protein
MVYVIKSLIQKTFTSLQPGRANIQSMKGQLLIASNSQVFLFVFLKWAMEGVELGAEKWTKMRRLITIISDSGHILGEAIRRIGSRKVN